MMVARLVEEAADGLVEMEDGALADVAGARTDDATPVATLTAASVALGELMPVDHASNAVHDIAMVPLLPNVALEPVQRPHATPQRSTSIEDLTLMQIRRR
jgi:hypothetical protein